MIFRVEPAVPNKLKVADHLTDAELDDRAKGAKDRDEWRRWVAIRRFRGGKSAKDIAEALDRKEDWVRRTVRDYNTGGPEAVTDGRAGNGRDAVIDDETFTAFVEAMETTAPAGGGMWNGMKGKVWFEERTGRTIGKSSVYRAFERGGLSVLVPRPRHADADPKAQEDFKKKD